MSILALFSLSFALGLTGAMSPGPFLSMAIGQATRRGPSAGPLLVLGHGLIELVLMIAIVVGLGGLLQTKPFLILISFVGGPILVLMGVVALRGLKEYTFAADPGVRNAGLHPAVAGVVLSISNPFWFIWWISVAVGYILLAKDLGFYGLVAFYTGHVSADLVWFSFISFGVHFGGRYIKPTFLKYVLFVCNLFLVFFGLYFLVNGFRLL